MHSPFSGGTGNIISMTQTHDYGRARTEVHELGSSTRAGI